MDDLCAGGGQLGTRACTTKVFASLLRGTWFIALTVLGGSGATAATDGILKETACVTFWGASISCCSKAPVMGVR